MSIKSFNHLQSKQKRNFKLSLVAAAVINASMPVYAEEAETDKADESEENVIVIRSIRQNLHDSQQLKRNAETVVDAISAKDASMLPDRSVLEALSRIPGVSIGRFAGSNDPDHFGVEGSGLSLRGLTHSRSEFNGRDIFHADSGRGLGFEDVPPELMGSVVIYKNQTADMIEGGIAGTVSLNSKLPFDSSQEIKAFTIDATYGDMREEWTPSASALYSNQWENDKGRWGFLISVAQSELKAQSDGAQFGRVDLDDDLIAGESVFIPRTARLTRKEDDRDRQGASMALQWESPDKGILVTSQFIHSDSKLAWTENAIEFADDGVVGSLIPAAGTEFGFDNQGVFTNGVITSTAGWRGNDADRQPGGVFGAQHAMVSRYREDKSSVDEIDLNIQFEMTDRLTGNFDIQYVDATTEVFDYSVMGATRANVGIDTRGSTPRIDLLDPASSGDTTHFTNPYNYFWRSAMDHISDNEGDELAARFDAEYTFDNDWLKSIETGVRYSQRDQTTRQSIYNWGFLSEAWSGGGNAWFDGDAAASLAGQVATVDWSDFHGGGVLNVSGGNQLLFPSFDLVRDYQGSQDALAVLNGGWTSLAGRDGAEGHFLPNEVNRTVETSNAAYFKLNFENIGGGLDYWGNVGFRYVQIENETDGFIVFPDNTVDPDVPFDIDSVRDPDQQAFGDAGSVAQTAKNDLDKILPSLNVAIELKDDHIMRFAYSEAIALPQLGNLRNYVTIEGEDDTAVYGNGEDQPPTGVAYQRYTAKAGNPFLEPMESTNFDLTYEWYFNDVGNIAFSYFHKDLKNYFINGSFNREFTNNGATQVVEVGGATNGEKGTIQGLEFAYQQFFDMLPEGWNGLGVQFNYTYIDENGSPNPELAPDKPDSTEGEGVAFENVPLEGLSKDNLNFVVLYENDDLEARVAYNWRSDYLLTTKDVITTLPIYAEDRGQVDASIFYNINDVWTIGFQGNNLTNEDTITSMQINEAGDRVGRAWFTNDRRYSLVVRAVF